jgi:alpha-mannosidase
VRTDRGQETSPVHRTLLLAALVVVSASAHAQQKRIYIAPDDHTDYFWSGDDVTYRRAFLRMLDFQLALVDQTRGEPEDYQARYACDGSLWLWEYERNKTPAEFARLMERIRDGHVSAPLNAAVSCYGGIPAEAVLRGMYYSGRLERRFGTRFEIAVSMENQTLPYGLPSLWAGAGARYSWKGICNCATVIPDSWDREHEVYWAQGPDGARVLMKWNSQLVDNESMGGYAEARDPVKIVDYVSGDPQFLARYPYPVAGAFGYGWDDLQSFPSSFPTAARIKTDSTRRVIVSNELDFFHDFEASEGAGLPVVSKSFGNEWDLLCATMAEVSASVKRSLAMLQAGEQLATLASLFDRGFMDGRAAARDLAFMDLGLYWEHDWTANNPAVPVAVRAAWQRKLAAEIQGYAGTLAVDAVAALGDRVSPGGSDPRFAVWNPLSFRRDDVVDLPYAPNGPFHVVDVVTGSEVPSQVMFGVGGMHLRILASDVPPVGYRVFEVKAGAGSSFGPAGSVNGGVIQNSKVGLTVAGDGSIVHYVDKTRGHRDFAASIDGRELNDLDGDGTGKLTAENVGPVSVTLVASAGSPVHHTTRVTLVRDSDRVSIDNQIHDSIARQHEWAFSFKLERPAVHHEEVGAIALARLESGDGTKDGGGSYSKRCARYDWLTLNHFADVTSEQDGVGCTVANLDCYFFQLGRSTADTLDVATPRISALATGPVSGPYSWLGIQNQDGDVDFLQRFALRTHDAYDPVDAMETALAAESPLIAARVTGKKPTLPPDRFSLFENANPAVLLWALKPSEEGIENGVIARLWNVTDDPQSTVIQLHPRLIDEGRATTHLETDLSSIAVGSTGLPIDFAPQQMRTVRLLFVKRPSDSGR